MTSQPRTCRLCDQPVARRYGKLCEQHRYERHALGNRRKYVLTAERESELRERYDGRVRGRAAAIAAAWRWPKWAVNHAAVVCGLSRPRPERWSIEDLAFLSEHAGERSARWMARRLGRSLTAVIVMLKRQHISRRVELGYTQSDLCDCLGVDHHAVERWVRLGWLKLTLSAEGAGSARRWAVSAGAVRQLIRSHPMVVDLQHVDQLWFLDLVLGICTLPETADRRDARSPEPTRVLAGPDLPHASHTPPQRLPGAREGCRQQAPFVSCSELTAAPEPDSTPGTGTISTQRRPGSREGCWQPAASNLARGAV